MTAFTQLLRAEHKQILNKLDQLDSVTRLLQGQPSRELLVLLEEDLLKLNQIVSGDHHYKEEQLLFPAMFATGKASQGGPRCTYFMGLRLLNISLGPVVPQSRTPIEESSLGIPMEEHRECAQAVEIATDLINRLKNNFDLQDLTSLFATLSHYQRTLRRHIEKEDTCLFVLADRILSSEEQNQLVSKIDNDKFTRSKKMKVIVAGLAFLISIQVHAKTIEVKMLNSGKDGAMAFEPGFVQASPGDTIKFVPTHPSHSASSAFVPSGAKTWAGKVDQALSVKLDKEGVYIYKCDPHTVMGMVGVVQVGKAANLAEAKAAEAKLTPTFVMNQDRLKKYLANVK